MTEQSKRDAAVAVIREFIVAAVGEDIGEAMTTQAGELADALASAGLLVPAEPATKAVEDLARLIDPQVWQAREEDQVTLGSQWDFEERRRVSMAAAERVASVLLPKCRPTATNDQTGSSELSGDVVESVAKAIYEAANRDIGDTDPWEECGYRDVYRGMARAAIAAMSEPAHPRSRPRNRWEECEHLQHEIDRLTAGADETPAEPGVNPTPGQWIAKWNAASAEHRFAWALAIMDASTEARDCLVQDHAGELAALRAQLAAMPEPAVSREQVEQAALFMFAVRTYTHGRPDYARKCWEQVIDDDGREAWRRTARDLLAFAGITVEDGEQPEAGNA